MFHSKSIENVYSNNIFHAMFQNVRRSIALETANNTIALGSKPCIRCGIPTMPHMLLGKTTPLPQPSILESYQYCDSSETHLIKKAIIQVETTSQLFREKTFS